jgi:two-component sensor histidine kinase
MEAELVAKKYTTSETRLLTRDGRLIYATKAFRFLEDVSGDAFFKQIKGENHVFLVEENRTSKLFASAHSKGYREFAGFGWILVVGHHLEDVLQPSLGLRNKMITASLILIILGITLATFITRSITRQLSKLSEGVERIGQGDFDHPIELTMNGELVELATAFNQMAKRRQKAEEQLKAALEEKVVLLRELYHRTKNNMEVIRSMLALQAAHSRNELVESAFKDAENRIQAMALVHQKLYQSQDLSRIDLHEYIQDLAHLLIGSYQISSQRISLMLDIEPVSVLIDTAIPCGLVLNELISNALKHAFPGDIKGEITIRLFRTDQEDIELQFSDNGIGVPNGFDFRTQETLGLQTIFAVTEHQLQGQVHFEVQNGITSYIRLKSDLYTARV